MVIFIWQSGKHGTVTFSLKYGRFWIASSLNFLSFVTIILFFVLFCKELFFFTVSVFEFCPNLSFWVLSHCKSLSYHNLSFSMVTEILFLICDSFFFSFIRNWFFFYSLRCWAFFMWGMQQFMFLKFGLYFYIFRYFIV